MNRFLILIALAVCVSLSLVRDSAAQVYTVYYPSPPVVTPAPVTTYYVPQSVYYAPTTSYYAPSAVTYYRRPIIGGGISGWRYNYAPVAVYRYPATTAYYYPAW
jgi:hypothetical protein